jgi:hypothetical protein
MMNFIVTICLNDFRYTINNDDAIDPFTNQIYIRITRFVTSKPIKKAK